MLVLPKNSSLNLLSQPPLGSKPPPGCLLANHPAIYKPPPHGAWLDPSNWMPTGPSPRPHIHQVPCQHDHVVFPTDMTYKMSVLDEDVTVSKLSMNGRALDSGSLRTVFQSDVGKRMFNVSKSVRITDRQCTVRRFSYFVLMLAIYFLRNHLAVYVERSSWKPKSADMLDQRVLTQLAHPLSSHLATAVGTSVVQLSTSPPPPPGQSTSPCCQL